MMDAPAAVPVPVPACDASIDTMELVLDRTVDPCLDAESGLSTGELINELGFVLKERDLARCLKGVSPDVGVEGGGERRWWGFELMVGCSSMETEESVSLPLEELSLDL
mmetsp:Transcript_422/g.618  ORF Transcript_422/g.618 Transcript_422/m.618 type:complete len:109 (+) Transcript_422:2436-2762(+)